MEPISKLEEQLIRSSLATKTDDEIAELLERPVEEIRIKISEITGAPSEERNQRVNDARAAVKRLDLIKHQAKKKAKKVKPEIPRRERSQAENQWEQQTQANARKIEENKYSKRDIDWSKMKSVRVNKSTCVFVKKEISDRDAIAQYEANRVQFGGTAHLPAYQDRKQKKQ